MELLIGRLLDAIRHIGNTRLRVRLVLHNSFWQDEIEKFLDPFPKELAMEKLRQKYFGDLNAGNLNRSPLRNHFLSLASHTWSFTHIKATCTVEAMLILLSLTVPPSPHLALILSNTSSQSFSISLKSH